MPALRIFFMEDGKPRRIPMTRFERLHRGDERMPEMAGKKVRYVFVSLDTEDRRPVAVVYAEFGVLFFNQLGGLDEDARRESHRLAMDTIGSMLGLEDRTGGSVIDAKGKFAQKRHADTFKWKPTPEEAEAIRVALWGRGLDWN